MELNAVFVIYLLVIFPHVEGNYRLIDLTHPFDNTTIYWPTARQWKFKLMDAGSSPSFEFEAYRFCTAEHGGTHLDAPVHFAPGTQANDEVPLDNLVGEAFIVDVSKLARSNRDLLISTDHILSAEKLHKTTIDNRIVLLYTGFSHYWPNLDDYLGTASTNASLLHFPGLDPEAAKWIVENRKPKSIGIDTASIDYGQSKEFLSHRRLLKENIPVFENLNLVSIDVLKSREVVMIYALPMKIKGGSGGPLRAIAMASGAVKSRKEVKKSYETMSFKEF